MNASTFSTDLFAVWLEKSRIHGKDRNVANIPNTEYLTVPDLVERLHSTPSKIRRMIEQRHLAAVRIDGVLSIPELFLDSDEPLASLHGTLMLLHDAGFSDEEAIAWMFDEDAGLDVAPIHALRSGRKSEVRRTAQALAF